MEKFVSRNEGAEGCLSPSSFGWRGGWEPNLFTPGEEKGSKRGLVKAKVLNNAES